MIFEHKQASEMGLTFQKEGMRILIAPELLQEIKYICSNVETEVSGLGDVERIPEGYVITKLRFFEQECTASETEIKPETLEKLSQSAIDNNEDLTSMRLWWHSHAKMGVFWSKTDDDCIESLLSAFSGSDKRYVMSIVVNHKGELLARMDFLDPVKMTFNHVPLLIGSRLPEEKKLELKDMIEKNVKSKKYEYKGYQHTREEPYINGTWNPEISAYIHQKTGEIFDFFQKEWLPRDKWEEKKKKRIEYHKAPQLL